MKRYLAVLAVATWALGIGAAHAQGAYPSQPVKIVCGFPAGSALDIITRVYAERLQGKFGQPFVVENRVGASGNIAAEAVARAAPDGYTLLTNGVTQAISMSLFRNLPYSIVDDFEPIGLIGTVPIIMVVNSQLGARSLKDLIALAKAKPGELTSGTAGAGAIQHLSGELFNMMAGVKLTHVHYRGSPQAIQDLLGGRISLVFAPAATIAPHLNDTRVTVIGVTSAKRSTLFPDIPTLAESGLPGFDTSLWNGMWAPKGTPKPVVQAISKVIGQVSSTPEGKKQLAATGTEAHVTTPEEFAAFVRAEVKKWAGAVEFSGAKLN